MGIVKMLSKMLSSLSDLGTKVCVRFYVALFLPSFRQPVLLRVRSSRFRRAAGMLEYSLVALISIAVFWAIKGQLIKILEDLADKIGIELNKEG